MNENKEIWKDIKGFEGHYQVSNFGRVKSIKFGKERILRPGKNKKGYLRVGISKNGESKTYSVHRLVAQAFIPNLNNLPQINHKNEDKTDNRVENLEFCDAKYNNTYGTRIQRFVENMKGHPNWGPKHQSEESKRKTSVGVKNNLPKTAYKKGHKPWNTGTHGVIKAWNRRRVLQYTKDMVFVAEFESVTEAIEKTGVKNIAAVARGKSKTSGGFVWKYKN